MTAPAVSVVMTVYNGEPWLGEAVDSILAQTFQDFELVVVDDGSSDGTPDTLRRRAEPRLHVIHQHQTGQTPALNVALRQARGPLIARLDADDVALPERLARQVAFFAKNPRVGLLGTGSHEISPDGQILSTDVPPVDDRSIRRALIRKNPFVHSAVMFRRAALDAAGPYDEGFVVAQDYDLWLRMSRVTVLANLPEPLVLRRRAPGQLSTARDTTRIRDEVVAKTRALKRGTYPLWYALYLGKPLCALAFPPAIRRALRQVVFHRDAPARGIHRA